MSLMITTLKVRAKSDGFEFGCQISPAGLDSSVKFNLTIFFLWVRFSIDPT
jgi:hypothetical protein